MSPRRRRKKKGRIKKREESLPERGGHIETASTYRTGYVVAKKRRFSSPTNPQPLKIKSTGYLQQLRYIHTYKRGDGDGGGEREGPEEKEERKIERMENWKRAGQLQIKYLSMYMGGTHIGPAL
uniref:Uncharacterized protein n=1 Tax=Oryza glumipatula TaxID=40148 RepID=A0A0D9ZG82_9ORYZ